GPGAPGGDPAPHARPGREPGRRGDHPQHARENGRDAVPDPGIHRLPQPRTGLADRPAAHRGRPQLPDPRHHRPAAGHYREARFGGAQVTDRARATLAFVAPFAAYVGLMAVERALDLPPRIAYPVRLVVGSLVLLYF